VMPIFGYTETLQLIEIDPISGAMNPIGSPLGTFEAISENLATIDPVNNIFYLLGWDGGAVNLIGLNLSQGQIVSNAEVPSFTSEFFVGVGEGLAFDANSGSIVAVIFRFIFELIWKIE
jgi:hypothetical protein